MSPQKRLIAHTLRSGLYPLVLAGSVALALGLQGLQWSGFAIVTTTSLLAAAVCAASEFVRPETLRWRIDMGEAKADALHALLSNTIPTAIYRALFFGVIVSISESITARIGFGLWPMEAPILVQLAFALLVAELASYAIHRFLHESRLWPLHAVHHCSPRMYFLLAVRKHPIQALITYGGRLSVLWLLGIPSEVLTLLLALTAAHSFVQHSNVEMRTGGLGWVFATPEFHRVHHSSRPGELDSNYGDVLIVWDVCFGTRRRPVDPEGLHGHVGLPGLSVRQTWWSHLRLPFVWPGYSRASD